MCKALHQVCRRQLFNSKRDILILPLYLRMFTGHWGCKELQANLQEEREAAQRSIRKKLQGFAFQWPLVHLWAAPLKSPVSDTQHS